MRPLDIEKESFRIIFDTVKTFSDFHEIFPPAMPYRDEMMRIIFRVVHATADFDFVKSLHFTQKDFEAARDALLSGCTIVTDTNMALAGINKKLCANYGIDVVCYMGDEEVAAAAQARGTTRAVVSMERAVKEHSGAIYAIGNAPTALMRLCELIDEEQAAPSLVIGAPVGFVNVVESKNILSATDVPSIIAKGRKGGSPVAAAIINAILYELPQNARN